MTRKRYKPEEIVAKLRQVDILVSQGHVVFNEFCGRGGIGFSRSQAFASRIIAQSDIAMSAQLPSLSFLEPERAREKGRYFRRTCRDLFDFFVSEIGSGANR
jgi:hypothetical protein